MSFATAVQSTLVLLWVFLSSSSSADVAGAAGSIDEQQQQQQQGFPNNDKNLRIVNGISLSEESQFATSFYLRSSYDDVPWTPDRLCGATLIHSDVAISAAHCQGAFNYGLLGYDGTSYRRPLYINYQTRHPNWNYDARALNYDVMVSREKKRIQNSVQLRENNNIN
jgi:hypothetical protein